MTHIFSCFFFFLDYLHRLRVQIYTQRSLRSISGCGVGEGPAVRAGRHLREAPVGPDRAPGLVPQEVCSKRTGSQNGETEKFHQVPNMSYLCYGDT